MDTMQYTFYFGRVPTEYLDLDEYFEDDKGNKYYYRMDVDEEAIYLEDTCGRMIPFDRDQVNSLNNAVFAAKCIYSASDEAGRLFDKRVREAIAVVEHWEAEGQ